MKSLNYAPIYSGTKVFVAADLDVPIKDGEILDTFRLDKLLPTLQFITKKGGFPIIGGHIGRPKGQVVPELSTTRLKPYFDKNVGSANYELLENLRFDPREEVTDEDFAKELASKAAIYVNEAFSTSHRKDASIIGIPKFIPGYAGIRLEKEAEVLTNLLEYAKRPFAVIIGGAKLEDKKTVVSKFLEIADDVLLGGKVGIDWTAKVPANLHLPTDYLGDFKDIGHKTVLYYSQLISEAKTILWTRPMGMYEDPSYFGGSAEIANAIVLATKSNGAHSVAGGGDTLDIITKTNLREGFSFLSTGGGAMLDFLVNKTLPGIEALK